MSEAGRFSRCVTIRASRASGAFFASSRWMNCRNLINVLKGEMSLVGPRPALPAETAKYTPRQRQRLIGLPGVTGLWQVSGRASLSFERSIELDLYYIEHQSVGLYFRILLMTIPAVLSGDGAY